MSRIRSPILASILVLALVVTSVPAIAGDEPAFDAFRQKVNLRAVESGNVALIAAVKTLSDTGFLSTVFDLAREPVHPPVPGQEVLDRLNETALAWAKAYPFNHPFAFHSVQLLTNDWEPGKEAAHLGGILWVHDTSTNTYRKLNLRLTVNPRTFQVTHWSSEECGR